MSSVRRFLVIRNISFIIRRVILWTFFTYVRSVASVLFVVRFLRVIRVFILEKNEVSMRAGGF